MPRRNVRRGRCFLVMNIVVLQVRLTAGRFTRADSARRYAVTRATSAACAFFIWNGALFTMPSTIDENR